MQVQLSRIFAWETELMLTYTMNETLSDVSNVIKSATMINDRDMKCGPYILLLIYYCNYCC